MSYPTNSKTARPPPLCKATLSSARFTIGSGSTGATIAVGTINDRIYEPNGEYFYVQLNGASSVTLGTPSVAGASVQNNVAEPSVSLSNAGTVDEGSTAGFPITLSGEANVQTTIFYQTQNGTATTPTNYSGTSSGSIVVSALTSTASIPVATFDDHIYEANDEDFYVSLTSVTGGSLRGSGDLGGRLHP